jgi:hypothetical protein
MPERIWNRFVNVSCISDCQPPPTAQSSRWNSTMQSAGVTLLVFAWQAALSGTALNLERLPHILIPDGMLTELIAAEIGSIRAGELP